MSCAKSGTLMAGPTHTGGSGEGDSNPRTLLQKQLVKCACSIRALFRELSLSWGYAPTCYAA